MKRGIYWFRNDLRTSDNELLCMASELCDELICLYIVDERFKLNNPLGIPRVGNFRRRFLKETLLSLQSKLQGAGNNLLCIEGGPGEVISGLCKESEVDFLFLQDLRTTEELQAQHMVQLSLPDKVKVIYGNEPTLISQKYLPFSIDSLPKHFTDFRLKVERDFNIKVTQATPQRLPKSTDLSLQWVNAWDALQPTTANDQVLFPFMGGEDAAWKRIAYYLWETQLLLNYKETRNGLFGRDYSSRFSPWLALGCVSPRQIYWEIKRFETEVAANDSTYWLVFELLWRDYFHFLAAKHGDRIFYTSGYNGRIRHTAIAVNQDFEKWCQGKTGNDFINANMNELAQTGYMSNRGRQNVASYLINDLQGDWRWGAWYFESLLVDYDPCSNWGNWAYLAGVGADPRGHRKFDVQKQAEFYDPAGEYVRRWNIV